jgi:hypothetical protein
MGVKLSTRTLSYVVYFILCLVVQELDEKCYLYKM